MNNWQRSKYTLDATPREWQQLELFPELGPVEIDPSTWDGCRPRQPPKEAWFPSLEELVNKLWGFPEISGKVNERK